MTRQQHPIESGVSLPLSQIAISTIDLRRSDAFWREGLGFLPSATSRMFRGPTMSNLMQVEDAKTTTRWLVGQDEWLQIEIWQFENPVPRLQSQEQAPHHIGYSRCGVWVRHFEVTIERLEAMGYAPLTAAHGQGGSRRVCFRDPDGIYVEVFEQDPLSAEIPPPPYDCDVALRSITLSTPDFESSCQFMENGLGLTSAGFELHEDEHEGLWLLDEASCKRKTYVSAKMLLEVVQYVDPVPVPRHPHSRLIDQGILNIAFGSDKSVVPIRQLEDRAISHGAAPTERMITPLGGCVYVTDPQGFSYEFTWASPFLGQRVAGYFPRKSPRFFTADNVSIECDTLISATAESVWPYIVNPELMNEWSAIGSVIGLRDGERDEFGVGAERKLIRGRHEMVEQIVASSPCRELRYRLIRRGPFANLSGELHLEEEAGRTRLTWLVRFRSKWPFCGWLLRLSMQRHYEKSLERLKQIFDT